MISHISGTLRRRYTDEQRDLNVEIEAGGLAYEVMVPPFVWRALEEVPDGAQIELDIYYHATQQQPTPTLIGFLRDIERAFFKKLIKVQGIGPSVAAKALTLSVSTVARAIAREDEATLQRLPGISEKRARLIIAKLREEVIEMALLQDEGFEELPEAAAAPTFDEVKQDAIAGLVHLGFQQREATRLVDEIVRAQALESVEEIIRAVFRATQQG